AIRDQGFHLLPCPNTLHTLYQFAVVCPPGDGITTLEDGAGTEEIETLVEAPQMRARIGHRLEQCSSKMVAATVKAMTGITQFLNGAEHAQFFRRGMKPSPPLLTAHVPVLIQPAATIVDAL